MHIQTLESRILLTAYDQDPTFGTAGTATADFFAKDDTGQAMAIQADGKILVVGSAQTSSAEDVLAVARFNLDGSLDGTFAGDGRFDLKTDLADQATSSDGYSVAIQTDNKILVGGVESTGGFLLFRLMPDGTTDSSFGSGVQTEILDTNAVAYRQILSIHELASGKILVGGVANQLAGQGAGQSFVALARYNANGTLDSTFGTQGTLITSLEFSLDGDLMDVQSDGKIVVVGSTADGKSAVARFSADGAADAAFGTAGVASFDLVTGVAETMRAVKVRSDDKIMVLGQHDIPGADGQQSEVLRLSKDGALDTSFSGDGRYTIQDSTFARTESIFINPDNSVLVGGDVITESVLYSLKSNGQLDPSFGVGGELVFSGGEVLTIGLQNGKIVVLRPASNLDNHKLDFEVVRFGNDNISLSNGTLSILGTGKNDTIFFTSEDQYTVVYNGATGTYDSAQVSRIDLQAVGGDDSITFDQIHVPATLSCGSGDDTLLGENGDFLSSDMIIRGDDGNDVIDVSNNPSLGLQIEGGDGNDLIKGTDAPDSILGGAGKDTIYGSAGNDRISGGGGKDHVNAGTGSDRIYGGAGDDQLDGGPGNDRIFGQAGNDKLFGGKGNDQLDGGAGSDILIANAGDDDLFSNDGEADRLDGGSGNNSATIDTGIDSTIRIQTLV